MEKYREESMREYNRMREQAIAREKHLAAEFSRITAINRELEETRRREAELKEQEYLENV